jgi:hypothetical protein
MTTNMAPQDTDLRGLAIDRLRKKRGLQAHLLAYVTVNLLLAVVWLATTSGGFYWPAIPLLGWGIGVVFNVWDVYSPQPDEKHIAREMRRLAR